MKGGIASKDRGIRAAAPRRHGPRASKENEFERGSNMKKLSWKKIGCLFLAVLMTATMMATGVAAWDNVTEEKGSITIWKYEQYAGKDPAWDTDVKNDGSPLNSEQLAGLGEPLKGVTFTLYRLTDTNYNEEPDENGIIALPEEDQYTVVGSVTTDEAGKAAFSELPLGRYLVKENRENAPEWIDVFTPDFYVDLPLTNEAGDGLIYDVNVYPKNQLIRGAVKMEKKAEDGGSVVGAEFAVYPFVEGNIAADYLATNPIQRKALTEADNGTIRFDNLPKGKYVLLETKAPAGYTLDSTPKEFEITKDARVVVVKLDSLTNYKQLDTNTAIQKSSAPVDSTQIKWTITTQVPTDIATYQSYRVTDEIPNELTLAATHGFTATAKKADETALTLTSDMFQFTPSSDGQSFAFQLTEAGRQALTDYSSIEMSYLTDIDDGATPGKVTNHAHLHVQAQFDQQETQYDCNATANIYGIEVNKVNLASEKLEGAVFQLQDKDGNIIKDNLTTVAGQSLLISGLNAGAYKLVETAAPDGYALLKNPLAVTITASDTTFIESVTILNTKNVSLPITGGIGTLLFTFGGLALMGAAVLLYIRSRKKGSAQA